MLPLTWPCPLPGGGIVEEYSLAFDDRRKHRLLIVPALFDEANRMRRQTVEVMRRLDRAGIDSFLPDFPGSNESPQPLALQSCDDWRDAMAAAATHYQATHLLTIRGGCLFAPIGLPGWMYAPTKGSSILRQMIRSRILASRESGREETSEGIMEVGEREGTELAGYRIGPDFVVQFAKLELPSTDRLTKIDQEMVGNGSLWLRAEPSENREQADALAAIVAVGIKS